MSEDREYWRVKGAWHAYKPTRAINPHAVCGRWAHGTPEWADRISTGHLCGACARIIAARTDIER